MHQVAAAHVETGKEELVRKLQTRYPLDANGRHPVRFALQSGRPDVHQNITDAELVSQARDSEQLNLLRDLRIRSYMCVPMKARGQALGTIFFGSKANKRFNAGDLQLAQLAHTAALAVDNARLYREARDEIAERKRTERDPCSQPGACCRAKPAASPFHDRDPSQGQEQSSDYRSHG